MMYFIGKYLEHMDCYGCGLKYKMCDLQYDNYMDGWYCYTCTDVAVCNGCGEEYTKNHLEYLETYNAHYCKYCNEEE